MCSFIVLICLLFLVNNYCSAGDGNHEHGTALTHCFVAIGNTHDGIGSEFGSFFFHFFLGGLAAFDHRFLIAAATTAKEIMQSGKKVLYEIHSEDDLSGNESLYSLI